MADAQDSVTTVDEPHEQRKGRFGFGRRKDKGDGRSETEWVDTLRAQEDDDREEGPTVSPFAAPEEEPAPEHDPSALSALPEAYEPAPQEAEPAYATPTSQSMSNGDAEEVYERSWTRRRHEEMDDIHHFVDNVLGTSLDPARRRRLMSQEVGLSNRVERERSRSAVRVEGIDEELMIAFTFPEEEFRGARVVYETEGGYVLEVQRAVNNDDKRTTHQYYTVSRVGEVAHVLDKMRQREMERDHAELQRVARADRQGVEAPPTAPEQTPVPPASGIPDSTPAPDEGPDHVEALPDSFGQEQSQSDAVPAVEREPTPEPAAEAPAAAEAPQVDVGNVPPTETDAEEPGDDAAKRRFGFGRKKGTDADEADDTDAADAGTKRRLFGRKRDDDAETASGSPTADEATEDASEADAEGRKRGIFRFKKGDGDDEA